MAHKRQRNPPNFATDYVEGILVGDRTVLGRAITLVESTKPAHQALAEEIMDQCLPHTGQSLRLGITGSPGVGKSSFIETFGSYLTQEQGRKLAVLTIDPSSRLSKGSILGDKTRMGKLSTDTNAFIRPSPAGDALGGVAARTREAMLLCEAAGFDTIFIETVGVGQSETAVHGMVDFFLLLLLPGAGDELQGIKRGIVEMADLIAINKADGDQIGLANAARKEYAGALHLFPLKPSGWPVKAVTCSALVGAGMTEIWQLLLDFQQLTKKNGWFFENRKAQAKLWLHERIAHLLKRHFYQHEAVKAQLPLFEKAVLENKTSANKAAGDLIRLFKNEA